MVALRVIYEFKKLKSIELIIFNALYRQRDTMVIDWGWGLCGVCEQLLVLPMFCS